MEEPPAHVKFILATTDPQKLPVTVLSRCLQFHLRNFSVEQIAKYLAEILTDEKISFESGALLTIGQCANGSMRDALSLLEQVISFGERKVTLQAAQQILGTSVNEQALQLLEQVINGDARQAISIVRDLAANNADFNRVLKTLQTLIHQLSLVQLVPEGLASTVADFTRMQQLAQRSNAFDLQLYYQATLLAVRDLPYAPDIVTGFEMLVLRMVAFQPVLMNKNPEIEPKIRPEIKLPAKAEINQAPPDIKEKIPSWADLIPQLNLPGLTKVIAENCTINNWQDDAIDLILHESQKPLLNAKHIDRIQEALQNYLQRKIKFSISAGHTKTETPAVQQQRLQSAAQSSAETAIRADKHIQELEQAFAAKIDQITLPVGE